jgi:hypothetical protein
MTGSSALINNGTLGMVSFLLYALILNESL